MNPICYTPIGVIHTPFREMQGMPIQAIAGQGVEGTIILDPAYAEGLRDIEGFSHLILLYHLHQMTQAQLVITPFLDSQPHGIFATRGPGRPNAIGFSTVRLVRVEKNLLYIQDVDMLDGTPLLDLKPYVPQFDDRAGAQIGWVEANVQRVNEVRADERYK
jgi:tRNA (adenine37-N6)-methyltransferase